MKILKKIAWNAYLSIDGSHDKYKFCKQLKYIDYSEVQKKNLIELMCHCRKNVPFYSRIGDSSEFSYDEFRQIPLMSKDEIRANFDALISTDHHQRNSYKNSSGGSTGEPLVFIQDKLYSEWGRAVKSLYDSWSGLEPCDKQLRLWGSERDVVGQGLTIKQRVVRWIKNEKWINTFTLDDKLLEEITVDINKNNYKQITSYVDTAHELSRYILRNNKIVDFNGSIITSAGTLFPEARKMIENAMNCSVFNRYGSREVGDIACSNLESNGLLVFSPIHFVEVLDNNGNPVSEGEIGEVIVTTLKNFSMPLIRYRIGDIAKVKKYNANGSVAVFESVEGRSTDLLKSVDGKTVLPAYFIHMFGVVEKKFSIKKIQFIQRSNLEIKIVVCFMEEIDKNMFEKISSEIVCNVLGDVGLEVEYVSDIPKNRSGKFQYVISHVNI
ncbi:hypothetical protein CWN98_12550 [Vibrio splendidus]|uniref:phenylacetate--CoA ligase family protein n=1 Tax=Vibrio splendidus TaxID=29497 RepID=UPI000D3DBD24|nr:phenylacetate--CoA ligase family protein [Vibrio splendidus]PTO86895.1 hypothetical protein CWN98_12550 [Vibrio splendidus]PTP47534.1 hypothetical protein CWO10_12015 [Vibrio splendidus]